MLKLTLNGLVLRKEGVCDAEVGTNALAVGCFSITISACGDEIIAPTKTIHNNRDVPQHFTMMLEITLERTQTNEIGGRLQGHLVFDEILQTLAREAFESGEFGNDPTEFNLLTEITHGKKDIGLAGFTIMAGESVSTTNAKGYFALPVAQSMTSLDVMYEDVNNGDEVRVRGIEIPEDLIGTNRIVVPLEFDHRFAHGHSLHDHARDYENVGELEQSLEANMSTNDLRCCKCNGWWNIDGGRAGSDCFRALARGFGSCWAESMNLDRIFGGRYCNGARNCSMYIGHGWNDNHTHGSSSWQCR